MITQTFNLNMIPEQAPTVIHCDQYDVGEGRLIAKLYDGATPYTPSAGATAVIQGMKPDNHGFIYSATISGNTVTADLTNQMSVVAGRVFVQIVVTETDDRTGSFVFFLDVQRSALPDDSELSESDLSYIEELIETAQSITSNFPYIGANGNWWYYDVNQGAYVDSGVDASITVTVGSTTTLPAGSAATVTNSGTATDPILNFGIPQGPQGNPGTPGVGIPSGGTTGQILQKSSNDDYATTWGNLPPGEGVPAGGTTGQVLAKQSNTDYDTEWVNQSGGADKADKVVGAVAGDFAGLDASGNLTDSGKKASDFATPTDILVQETLLHDTAGWIGKNLLENKASDTTFGSVAITVFADGSMRCNGSTTSNANLTLNDAFTLPDGEYILSDAVPSAQRSQTSVFIIGVKSDNTEVIIADTRNTTTFTASNTYVKYKAFLAILANVTYSNLDVYPMIRHAFITDDTFVPHHASVEAALSGFYSIMASNGAVNILPFPYYDGSSLLSNGVNFAVDSEGNITANRASASSSTSIFQMQSRLYSNFHLRAGKYRLTGCPANGSQTSYYQVIGRTSANNTWQLIGFETGNGLEFTITEEQETLPLHVTAEIHSSYNANNIVFTPQIAPAAYIGTREPYAMTNKELTEKVNGIISAATNAADFAAFKTAISAL